MKLKQKYLLKDFSGPILQIVKGDMYKDKEEKRNLFKLAK